MYGFILLFLGACGFVVASRISMDKPIYSLEDAEKHFEAFIEKYNRVYYSETEKKERFEIFKQRLEEINKFNSDPLNFATYDINMFSDTSTEEFARHYTGLDISLDVPGDKVDVSGPVTIQDLPDNFNWVDHNVVTRVKDQGCCGSCWAFSVVGVVEGAYALKYGKQMEFSEQQLVDCDSEDNGCGGGLPQRALRYLKEVGGIEGETDYVYTEREEKCKFDAKKVKAKIADVIPLNLTSEEALRQKLYTDGPISISLCANNILYYSKGIFTKSQCPADRANHAVLLVGYGTENGVPFWIIKNSYSAAFGEKGYFRITRNENTCGLLNDWAALATVA